MMESSVNDTLDAAALRRMAMECAAEASGQQCAHEERERLLRMRESLLALANDADWLAGRVSPLTRSEINVSSAG